MKSIAEVRKNFKIEDPVFLIGFRGFFSISNDRGIYDDAIFVVLPGDTGFFCFNANCDPGFYRAGIANLKTGLWLYKLGPHGLSKPLEKQYEALVQAGDVLIHRDGEGEESGRFGINIHRGSEKTVSSEGCQTIQPKDWPIFINLVKEEMKKADMAVIKYALVDA